MASTRLGHRAYPFVQQDPNSSRYSRRLSKEEWESLEPKVSELFCQGVSTADILRQLTIHFDNVHITRNQLDTQMRKWGLVKQKNAAGQQKLRLDPIEQLPIEQLGVLRHYHPSPASLQFAQNCPASTIANLGDFTWRTTAVIYTQLLLPPYIFKTAIPCLLEPAALEACRHLNPAITAARTTTQSMLPFKAAEPMEYLKNLSAMAHTALLLTDMRCYSEAFETWLLILSSLNDATQCNYLWVKQLMYVAVTCARSAFTDEQKLAAEIILEQVCHRRGDHLDSIAMGYQPSENVRGRELRELQQWAEDLPVGKRDEPEYWAVVHYSAYVAPSLYSVLPDKKDLWSKDLRDWPKASLHFFFESLDVQLILVDALATLEFRIWSKSATIDERLERHWPPTQSTSTDFARTLACLVLKHYQHPRSHFGLYSPSEKPTPANSEEISIQVKGQALVILPFVVVHWIQEAQTSQYSWPRCSVGLHSAVQRISKSIDIMSLGSRTQYKEFVAVYVDQLCGRANCDDSIRILSSQQLIHAAAAIAGVNMSLESEQPQSPPKAISELDKAQLGDIRQESARYYGQSQRSEQGPSSSFLLGPPMARSYASSISSAYRSFKGLSTRVRDHDSSSNEFGGTNSTGRWPSRMSWQSGSVIGLLPIH